MIELLHDAGHHLLLAFLALLGGRVLARAVPHRVEALALVILLEATLALVNERHELPHVGSLLLLHSLLNLLLNLLLLLLLFVAFLLVVADGGLGDLLPLLVGAFGLLLLALLLFLLALGLVLASLLLV